MISIVPSLPVTDLGRCVEFYRKVLGFDLVEFSGRGSDAFAVVRMGEVEIIFRSHADVPAPSYDVPADPNRRIALHFLVPDAESLYKRVAGHARIVRDYSVSLFGGREFSIEDPNGLVLWFRQHAPASRPSDSAAALSVERIEMSPG